MTLSHTDQVARVGFERSTGPETSHLSTVAAAEQESTQLGAPSGTAEDELQITLERLDQQVRDLQAALLTNRRIGVAVGIVMCELRVTETAAFAALRRISMNTNRKLRDVAEDVIDTGALPPDHQRHVAVVPGAGPLSS